MAPWTAVLAVSTALAFIVKLKNRRKFRDIRRIPIASHTLPVLGRIRSLKDVTSGRIHRVLEGIAGDADETGLVRFILLGSCYVVATTSPAAHAVFRGKTWMPKSQLYRVFDFFGMRSDSIISHPNQDEHARLRKEFAVFFSASNIESVLGRLAAEISKVTVEVSALALRSPDGKARVDACQMATSLIDLVVRKVFFETAIETDLASFSDALVHAAAASINPFMISLIKLGLTPSSGRYRRNWKALHKSWAGVVSEAYSRDMPDDCRAFWACLRRAYPQAMTDKKQYDDVVSNTALVYGAGSETTANSIAMTLAVLALDPESLTRLEAELDSAGFLATAERPTPRTPGAKDMTLQWLEAIVHESLRIFPPAPSGTLRRLKEQTDICGRSLPAGTNVFVPVWPVHHNPKVWGEDAKSWRPQRWLEGRSINAVKKDAAGLLRWIPFADGTQNCIGQHLAVVEVKLALCMLIGRFHLSMDKSKSHVRTPEDLRESCMVFFTLHQKDGVFLELTPRVVSPA